MTGNNYSESVLIQTQSADAQPIHYIHSLMFSINKVGKDKDCPPRCNLDSHADTCVAGGNALEISHEDDEPSRSPAFQVNLSQGKTYMSLMSLFSGKTPKVANNTF
jgi:hypothetical protein